MMYINVFRSYLFLLFLLLSIFSESTSRTLQEEINPVSLHSAQLSAHTLWYIFQYNSRCVSTSSSITSLASTTDFPRISSVSRMTLTLNQTSRHSSIRNSTSTRCQIIVLLAYSRVATSMAFWDFTSAGKCFNAMPSINSVPLKP